MIVSKLMCVGLMRKEHPGVALSVKTHQAIRSVLNHSRDTIKQLLGGGVLDESDAEKLLLVSCLFHMLRFSFLDSVKLGVALFVRGNYLPR